MASETLTGKFLSADFARKLPGLPEPKPYTIHDQTGPTVAERNVAQLAAHTTTIVPLADGRVRLVCACGVTREADHAESLGWQCAAMRLVPR